MKTKKQRRGVLVAAATPAGGYYTIKKGGDKPTSLCSKIKYRANRK